VVANVWHFAFLEKQLIRSLRIGFAVSLKCGKILTRYLFKKPCHFCMFSFGAKAQIWIRTKLWHMFCRWWCLRWLVGGRVLLCSGVLHPPHMDLIRVHMGQLQRTTPLQTCIETPLFWWNWPDLRTNHRFRLGLTERNLCWHCLAHLLPLSQQPQQ
jgi:hypothetical protein